MRIALISDIHGNLVALEAALASIHQEEVDQIICLGDVATIGPQPHGVVARLKALGVTGITGNHESYLLNPERVGEDVNAPPWLGEMVDWCAGQLASRDLDYLRSFHSSIEIRFDAETCLLGFHGSPRSNTDIILATTPAAGLDEMLSGYRATIMAGGHTHVQMVRQHNGVMIVNVGSVGEPLEQMPVEATTRILPWAEYVIVSWANRTLGIEARRVPIDVKAVGQAVLASDMPDAVKAVWARIRK